MFGKSQKFVQFRQSDLDTRINRSRIFGDGDDSIDDARSIKNLSKSKSFEDDGRVSDDDPDYYKFKLKKSGNLKFSFRNRGDESIRFSVVDSDDRVLSFNGRRLFVEVDDGEKSKFDARFRQGTYYLRIETEEDSSQRYNFKLKVKQDNRDDDDDDD